VKNQTVDLQPQDQLISWIEDANKKIEKAIAIKGVDEELQRSTEWASVIQRFQSM